MNVNHFSLPTPKVLKVEALSGRHFEAAPLVLGSLTLKEAARWPMGLILDGALHVYCKSIVDIIKAMCNFLKIE